MLIFHYHRPPSRSSDPPPFLHIVDKSRIGKGAEQRVRACFMY